MVDKVYNLTQEEANVIVEKFVSSQKYRIFEQSSDRVILKENTLGNFLTHLIIFGVTFWSYGIFNLIYAISSGETVTINIKKSSLLTTFNVGNERFAEIELDRVSSNRYTGSYYINHDNIDDKNAKWLKKGELLEIAGLTIDGGMIYVSPKASNLQNVISTNLPISDRNVQPYTKRLDYWPSYAEASPDARKAYLEWLADGRKDPNADIGYVFLFFYGLEWRFFREIQKNKSLENEIQIIIDELERLIKIYSEQSYSFKSYAKNLLEYIKVNSNKFCVNDYLSLDKKTFMETPFPLLVELGKHAYEKKPLYPELALAWSKNSTCYFRTPASRCEKLFDSIFIDNYKKKFKEGIMLSTTSKSLELFYNPASHQIRKNTKISLKNVSDISKLKKPLLNMQKLINYMTDILDPYSRFLGRNPNNISEASLYLPDNLRYIFFEKQLETLKKDINNASNIIPLSNLLLQFGLNDKISTKSVPLFIELLNNASIIFIPSKPIGKKLDNKMFITLSLSETKFKIDEIDIAYPRIITYTVSHILSGLIELNDDNISNIVSTLTKSESNKIYLKTIFRQEIKPAELKFYLQQVDKSKRETFLRDVMAKVADIIDINPNIIKKIEKIGLILSIEAKELHSIIHNAHSREEIKKDNKLNFDKISKLKKSSKEISEILDKVFIDDHAAVSQINKPIKNTACILNFTGKKEEFFNVLISKDGWDKNDLSKIARDKGLMFEGILEEINEQAFEVFDDTLIELDDKIYVNLELLEA